MTIRLATEHDIPAIVEVLKLSLGESRMSKSEAFWRWKHVDNPYGKSPVLLAIEGDEIVGVRAFMRWEWKLGDKVYKAVRAVDTATHPKHQRKGIFKDLTLKLVKQSKDDGVDFIFNTPNKSSMPGYLKMGWMSNGRMKIFIKPFLLRGSRKSDFDSVYELARHTQTWNVSFESTRTTTLMSNISREFLLWRYARNPNLQYYAFSEPEKVPSYITIFRLKTHPYGLEFRICETLHSTGFNKTDYNKHLRNAVRDSGANVITSSEVSLFPSLRWSGPEITTYPISFDNNFLSSDLWKPSLGDMEVF